MDTICLIAAPRTGTNHLCEVLRNFPDLASYLEVFENDGAHGTDPDSWPLLRRLTGVDFATHRDPRLIAFAHEQPGAWLDALEQITGRRPVGERRLGAMGAGEALWKFDSEIIDGGVNGSGWMTRVWGTVSSWWDSKIIDRLLVNGPAYATMPLSWLARMTQWGLVQWYALVMVAGLAGFAFYYLVM